MSLNNESTKHTDPFDELGPDDQKAAIDVAIAAILIGMRIPSPGQQQLHDWIATEFAGTHGLPSNKAKYALRSVGRTLVEEDWRLTITKEGPTFTTKFSPQRIKDE